MHPAHLRGVPQDTSQNANLSQYGAPVDTRVRQLQRRDLALQRTYCLAVPKPATGAMLAGCCAQQRHVHTPIWILYGMRWLQAVRHHGYDTVQALCLHVASRRDPR